MVKKTFAALAGIAALGISCARDIPVYSQIDQIVQNGNRSMYTEIWSNAEALKLSLYVTENARLLSKFAWVRFESADSTTCEKEQAYMFVGNKNADILMEDDECDGTLDSVLVHQNGQEIILEGEQIGNDIYQLFDDMRETIDQFLNIDSRVSQWHERKQ